MEHCIRRNPVLVFLFSFVFLLYFLTPCSYAVNTITRGELIRDGDSLISNDEKFELGFFSPGNSTLRYLGIWYYNINPRTVVWVANRNSPISNQNGTLSISADGNLEISDGNNSRIWSSNASIASNDTAAILHDDGNFVLSQTGSGDDIDRAFWQSFQNPTDTYLPGMRVRVNSAMGENQAFTSWKSDNDPSIGNYSLGIDPRRSPQIVIWENREKRRWRSGQWNAVIFTGVPNMSNLASYLYGFKLSTPDRNGSMYFTYVPSNTSDLLRFRIGWDGREEQTRWNAGTNLWNVVQRQPVNDCEFYNHCGNFGVCREFEDLKCRCINGFEPRNWEEWNRRNFTGGCRRRTPIKCERNNGSTSGGGGEDDGFRSLRSIKLPDFAEVHDNCGMECCRERCLINCSCTGYAQITGIGCMIWSGDLIDVQEYDRGGNLMHLRLAASELDGTGKISRTAIITISVLISFFVIVSLCLLWIFKGKLQASCKNSNISCCKSDEVAIVDMSKNKESSTDLSGPAVIDGNDVDCPDLPMYNFSSIVIATNNFSEENKLGQGGFGPVYKGKLPDGQDIAIKRLSRRSGQGVEEFKNEIILIAKLQHRNLVRLLGCCIEGEEKMLLYEYLLNKSLDFFLFDKEKQVLLDWPKRFTIIEGIARGLLYLHRDSRLRIIHRDLKASNILLDEDMNPKISDFGMARMFGVNQNEINTNRIVGTYGYMSPEYAMEGLFSVKSDVYSFGVLLLEIVSGRRNTSFRLADYSSLIGYAWHLWNEGRATELIDPRIRESCSEDQVMRCIHVGMLCVQDSAVYRPTMAYVVLLLESESPTLPMPKQPTYASLRSSIDGDFGSEVFHDTVSSNDLTVSNVVGR